MRKKFLLQPSILPFSLIIALSFLACSVPTKGSDAAALSSVTLKHGSDTVLVDLSSCAATIDCRWSSVSVIAKASDEAATLSVGGSVLVSGAESAQITTKVGTTTIVVAVSSGGSPRSYSLLVKRPDPRFPPNTRLLGAAYLSGHDCVVGGGDDILYGWGFRSFNAKGIQLVSAAFDKGSDGLLRTSDDSIDTNYYDGYWKMTYDDEYPLTDSAFSGQYGSLSQDYYSRYSGHDYRGWPVTVADSYGPGLDNVWGNSDDPVDALYEYSWVGGRRLRKLTEYSGGVVTKNFYCVYAYNDKSQVTEAKSFTPGDDGLPLTADDVVMLTTSYSYSYDPSGNWVSKTINISPISDTTNYVAAITRTYDSEERLVEERSTWRMGSVYFWRYVYAADGSFEREEYYADDPTDATSDLALWFYSRFRPLGPTEDESTATLPASYS
jgi:hypothetical protein